MLTLNLSDQPSHDLTLGIAGFSYADLYCPQRLRDLSEAFYASLDQVETEVAAQFAAYRAAKGEGYSQKDESNLLVKVAPQTAGTIR